MLTLSACSPPEQVSRHEAASDGELATDANISGTAPGAAALEIVYEVPEGWKAGKRSALRKAAWVIEDGDQNAEIAVISIAAGSEDLLTSVNRWRGQIDLEPTSQAVLDKAVLPIQVAEVEGQFVEVLAAESAQSRKCVLGVVAIHNDVAWFIKLVGDADLALQEKERFLSFVKSIRFEAGDGVAEAIGPNPHGVGPNLHGMGGDAQENGKRERVDSVVKMLYDQVPDGWTQAELRGVRRAAFLVQEDKLKALFTAEEALIAEGDLLPAVNTLRREVGLDPILQDEFDTAVNHIQVAGVDAPYFELVGPADARRPAAVLAVMVPYLDRVWFFTMKGDVDLVLREKERFEAFVKLTKLEVQDPVEHDK